MDILGGIKWWNAGFDKEGTLLAIDMQGGLKGLGKGDLELVDEVPREVAEVEEVVGQDGGFPQGENAGWGNTGS